ncbi:DUF2188 domain-containing protein [Desertimonas flava]|uniref:DUF2188 domain-containing protein n=1 Tax=Desertimonas flava TaxID=2064846 RepID=UPI000E344324
MVRVSPIHTVRRPDGWTNECDTWPRARDPHSTRDEAVRAGRERARQAAADHVLHAADGTVEDRAPSERAPRSAEPIDVALIVRRTSP